MRRLRRELIDLLSEALRAREQALAPRAAAVAVRDFLALLARPEPIGVHGRLLARGELYRHVLTLRCPDQAFYLDAVKVYLARRGIDPITQLAVVACASHAPDGAVTSICGPQARVQGNEMLVTLHVSATLVPDGRGLTADLKAILAAVAASVRDFSAMEADLMGVAGHLGTQAPEDAALLSWMLDKRYLMFGLMEGPRRLGILANRRVFAQVAPGLMEELLACRAPKGPGVTWLALPAAPHFLYGPVPLEVVRIAWRDKGHGKAGKDTGKQGAIRCILLVGYFARSARHTNAHQVPRLAGIWGRMRRRTALVRSAYLEREVRTVFDRVPKPILLTAPEDALAEALLGIVEKGGPGGAHVYVWDAGPWLIRVVAAVLPLNRFSTQVQEGVLGAVRAAGLEPLTHHNVAMGTSVVMFITCHGGKGDVALGNLTQAIREAAISWRDRALQAIRAGLPTAQVREAIQTLADLPRLYTDMFAPETFVEDLKVLRRVRVDGRPHVRLEAVHGGVTMYAFTALPVPLGRLVEIVQAFGLAALDEAVVDIPGDPAVHLTRLRCGYPEAVHADALPRLRAALEAVLADLADNDSLNALVLAAGLEADAVAVLITLRNHLVQLVPDASPGVLTRTLVAHPEVTAAVHAMFAARHHPDLSGREGAAREAFTALLGDRVENLTDDRWYRVFADLVGASLRTNAYTRGIGEPIAVKVKPADLPFCPHPVPYREIFVHSRHMEGVHLRGGPIARGGLRLSDRPTDFRTEVLELMATQVVKNGVIVPTGAKGGFVLKAGAGAAFAREQYRAFVRALLSVTDNLAHGKAVAPRGVRVRPGDEGDPYLVVAADKGTATFSDLANDEAARADFWPVSKGAPGGFWLGDAFASGGSNGYDHKQYGITARGAWVCVRQHFAGLGVDPERDPVTAVGIGDMGGDVFGNGMLLSRTLRLVAAFNHRHIFLDPNPDPKAAFAERRRMFEAGLGWDGYRADRLSRGGGVFERTAKRIPVSPEAAKVLGVEPGDLSGEALIRALLCAPVDLLYNGGIGTYVRAPGEPDEEARDPANKAVRVTSDRLRCKVIGEGGNLGLTQRARIDFARRGGLIHTDAVDNSGGVDMSDHEVNLKILLATIPGGPTPGRRNRLLRELGDEVADLCLADSRSQARALSVAAHRLAGYPALGGRLRDLLLAEHRLDPTDPGMGEGEADTLSTKPQLSVLMGHEKNRTKALLERDGFAAHSCFAPRLLSEYFPPRVVERYGDRLALHPLKDGIVHTMAASRIVARFGLFAFAKLQALTGAGAADAAQALFAAEALLSAEELRLAVWDLKAEPAVRLQADLQDHLVHLADELLRLCPVGSFCDEWVREQRGELTRFRHLVIREGRGGRGARGVRGAFARRMAEARKAGLAESQAAWAAAMPELTRVAVPLHLAGKLGISLWRCLIANRAVYALLPLATAEVQLGAPGWGVDDDTHALRVAWMRRLTRMRSQAVERLLAEGPRDPGAAGRRMWRRHADWAPIRALAGELEGREEAEPIKTVLLLTRLESLVDAPTG